jgi:hypothetical protein
LNEIENNTNNEKENNIDKNKIQTIKKNLADLKIFLDNYNLFNNIKSSVKGNNNTDIQTFLIILLFLHLFKKFTRKNFSVTLWMIYIILSFGMIRLYFIYQEYMISKKSEVEECYKQLDETFIKQNEIFQEQHIIIKKIFIQNFCKVKNVKDVNYVSKALTKIILDNNKYDEKIIFLNNEYLTIIKYKI